MLNICKHPKDAGTEAADKQMTDCQLFLGRIQIQNFQPHNDYFTSSGEVTCLQTQLLDSAEMKDRSIAAVLRWKRTDVMNTW